MGKSPMTALAGRRPAITLTASRTTEGSSAPSAPFVGSFRSTMSAPWLIASSASRLPVTLANNIVINALHQASHNSVERRVSGLLGGVVRRLINIDLELNTDWQSDRESEQNQRREYSLFSAFSPRRYRPALACNPPSTPRSAPYQNLFFVPA